MTQISEYDNIDNNNNPIQEMSVRITRVTMGVERTVRHAAYNISKPSVILEAEVTNYEEDVQELHAELMELIMDMVEEEKAIYQENKDNED